MHGDSLRVFGNTLSALNRPTNGLPRGQVVGQIAPLAACFEDIEDGVRDFAQGVVSGVSACFDFVAVEGAFEDGFEDCPFVVGQVCLVGLACDGLYSR
jgi:hypothetical protein